MLIIVQSAERYAYRRIKDDTCPAHIKVTLDKSGNVLRVSQGHLLSGVYTPTSVLAGEFTILAKTGKATVSAAKAAIDHRDFVGKYQLTGGRKLSILEESLVPKLEDWYIIPDQVANICKHAQITTGKPMQMRNFLLRGPAGTGKTQSAMAIAAGLHLPYMKYTCSASTEVFDFVGMVFPNTDSVSTGDAELDKQLEMLQTMGGINFANVSKLSTLQEATRKWNQLKADEVIKLIDKIEDPVTEKSKTSIEAARKAYDALTKDQKNLVTNVKKLTDAETAYAKLTASEEDKEKAQEVIDLIDKLKDVTPDSEKDIEAARKAYDALTDLQKKLVDNYDVLTTAETKLAMLKAMGKVSDPYITTGDYMEALGTPSVGSIGGEWMVIGLARSDRNVPGVEDYYKKVLEYVAENIDTETGRLHKAKSTDNSRIILALTAIGRDVTNVGGYDLLQGLSDLDFVKYQGNNGPIWALLALDSGNYPVPTGGTVTRQALIDEILRVQTSDGGWTVSGDKADSDMTGMALTALAPYYTKDLKVQEAIDKAVARLSEMQDEDGGYSTSYDGTTKIATSESISQVVTALSALGINADTDPRFVKNGNSVIDALLRYYVNGGGFKHVMDGELDGMATEQAYYALTAYYRFLTGKTNLYDMTDTINKGGDPVEVEPTVPATTEPAEVEPAKTNFPWWILVICVVGGCGLGMVIAIVIIPKFKKKD